VNGYTNRSSGEESAPSLVAAPRRPTVSYRVNICSSSRITSVGIRREDFRSLHNRHDALVTQAHLDAGERVLISGSTGGVGIAAVQIAHALART